MPSGVGGFLTGMMSEQERLRTAAADQQKVARERFDAAWRQAGEIEAEINSPSYTPDRIPALIEKARVWDSAYRDQLGTDTQQLMVFVQDYMGQYNSYLQGANSAIQQGNQTLQALATGR